MTNAEIIDLSRRYLFQVYARAPIAIVRGEGCRVWDADDHPYLDFFSSTVVTALGHAHPAITAALRRQADKILHVSNLHYSEPSARLAERLCESSFADRVFLCNSGAEANEAAIKLARKFGHDEGGGRFEIVTATGSFHGRTLATIVATGQEKVRVGFQPLPEGFRYAPFNDIAALESAVGDRTIAVLLEPIQGEGGIIEPAPGYLRKVRELCDRRGLLLILDEIQTGMGRAGTLFAHEQAGITPDIMTLAKGLGGGVPIGAMLATESIARVFQLGAHGSTFGGNALACAVGLAVTEVLLEGAVLENCVAMGARLRQGLVALGKRCGKVVEVRGQGLLIGAELTEPGAPVVDRCREKGLLINCTGGNVLRFTPPLIVTPAEVDEALGLLGEVLAA
jgi:predicted acetylornithine/succinylornithine family transaminase